MNVKLNILCANEAYVSGQWYLRDRAVPQQKGAFGKKIHYCRWRTSPENIKRFDFFGALTLLPIPRRMSADNTFAPPPSLCAKSNALFCFVFPLPPSVRIRFCHMGNPESDRLTFQEIDTHAILRAIFRSRFAPKIGALSSGGGKKCRALVDRFIDASCGVLTRCIPLSRLPALKGGMRLMIPPHVL